MTMHARAHQHKLLVRIVIVIKKLNIPQNMTSDIHETLIIFRHDICHIAILTTTILF